MILETKALADRTSGRRGIRRRTCDIGGRGRREKRMSRSRYGRHL